MSGQVNLAIGDDRIGALLEGRTVSRCFVDSAFGIQFLEAQEELTIRIEAPFDLVHKEEELELSPADPQQVGRAVVLVGKVVERAIVRQEGSLELSFTDGTRLNVPSDPDYEAWQLSSSSGLLCVSLPGGGLAVWGPG